MEKLKQVYEFFVNKVSVGVLIAYAAGAFMQEMGINAKVLDKILSWF